MNLAMAYGRRCRQNGLKAYFLKATELNQRLTDARRYGRESSTVNGLVKPSCLIIDDATVFMIKGNSYRGKKCETIALSAGSPSALPKPQH